MAKITIHNAVIAALEARGETMVMSRATSYVTYSRTWYVTLNSTDNSLRVISDVGIKTYYYVTRGGALRIGRSYTESSPMAPRVKKLLYNEGVAVLTGGKSKA